MTKFCLTLTSLCLVALSFGQNERNKSRLTAGSQKAASHPAEKVITNPAPAPTAAGDTVWVFDGRYSYDWNATLPATYSVALEDVDGDTIDSGLYPVFDTTDSYVTFYTEDAAATHLHYGHADTVFYQVATSWFVTPGQASNWIEFGPVHVPASGGTLMWMHNYIDVSMRDGYEVKVNTTGLSAVNYTAPAIFSVSDNDPGTANDTGNAITKVWYPRQASVNAYAGQDIYIAVHHNANNQYVFEFTNLMLVEASSTGIHEGTGLVIGANTPNPASGSTTITYKIPKAGSVTFSVTDLAGKAVYRQELGAQSAGGHYLHLNTRSFADGMYLYHFEVDGQRYTRKLVVSN